MCCSWLNPRWRNVTLSTHCGVGDEREGKEGEERRRRWEEREGGGGRKGKGEEEGREDEAERVVEKTKPPMTKKGKYNLF